MIGEQNVIRPVEMPDVGAVQMAGMAVCSLLPLSSLMRIQLSPLLHVTYEAGRHLFQKKEQRKIAERHIKRCMNSSPNVCWGQASPGQPESLRSLTPDVGR